MIIEKLKQNDISSEGLQDGDRKVMRIDSENMGKLQMLLSENLYSDAVGSIVRELTCNGVDAIVEAGKNPIEHPVVVSVYEENDNYFFSVKDTGSGLDDEAFENVLSSYLKSTKEASNETIGNFGIK